MAGTTTRFAAIGVAAALLLTACSTEQEPDVDDEAAASPSPTDEAEPEEEPEPEEAATLDPDLQAVAEVLLLLDAIPVPTETPEVEQADELLALVAPGSPADGYVRGILSRRRIALVLGTPEFTGGVPANVNDGAVVVKDQGGFSPVTDPVLEDGLVAGWTVGGESLADLVLVHDAVHDAGGATIAPVAYLQRPPLAPEGIRSFYMEVTAGEADLELTDATYRLGDDESALRLDGNVTLAAGESGTINMHGAALGAEGSVVVTGTAGGTAFTVEIPVTP